jgi:hypothetical protein
MPESVLEIISPELPLKITVTPIGAPAILYVKDIADNSTGFTVARFIIPGILDSQENVSFNWIAIARIKGAEQRRNLNKDQIQDIEFGKTLDEQVKIGNSTNADSKHEIHNSGTEVSPISYGK